MEKIYINNSTFILTKKKYVEQMALDAQDVLVKASSGSIKILLNCIDKAEKSAIPVKYVVYSKDLARLQSDFLRLFNIIKAAGGVVLNGKGEILVIYRKGFWDLPKGKLELGESKKQCAIREVKEETGLTEVSLIRPITYTYHSYRMNRTRILKKSFWYLMETTQTELIPQKEESIELAKWINIDMFNSESMQPMYLNIKHLVQGYFKENGMDLS